jgi:hypothetical protein
MAKTATAAINVNVLGDGLNLSQQFVSSNANAPPPSSVTLSAGNNTIAVPTGFTINGVTIVPPTTSAVAKVLKGVNADTGFQLGASAPAQISLGAVASFVINASSGEIVQLVWW